jgi:F0F1-type ATP synthase membrane subunit b/b'
MKNGQATDTPAADTKTPAATDTPPPAKTEATATDTKDAPSWKDSLPEDLRSDPSLAVIHDVPSLAKSFVNAQKLIGKNKIALPDAKFATDEDWAPVYKALGLPEKLDDYKLEVKEDAGLDGDFIKNFRENAHKSGILPKQAQKLIDWYSEAAKAYTENMKKQVETAREEAFGKLKKEWGDAYPKHEEAATVAVRDFATPEELAYMEARGFTGDPVLLSVFSKIGLTYKEDQIPSAQSRAGKDLMTPAQAQSMASQIISDATHPYNMKNHPKHAEAVEEVKRYMKMAYPTTEK